MVAVVSLPVEDDLLSFRADLRHFTKENLHVVLVANELSKRCCHIPTGDQSCGHLIQQGFEQVEVAFVDQGDADIRGCECLAGMDAGEPPPRMTSWGACRSCSEGGSSSRKQ